MFVSFEVRLKLVNSQGECAMVVRGNEMQRSGKRLLIPLGGGIKTTTADCEWAQKALKLHLTDDLRFATTKPVQKIIDYFYSFLPQRLLDEAKREFTEEAVDERKLLTASEAQNCRLKLLDRLNFTGPSVRHKLWGQPTLYLVAVVCLGLPRVVVEKLEDISKQPKALLEFVPPHLIQKTWTTTSHDSQIPPVYWYLR